MKFFLFLYSDRARKIHQSNEYILLITGKLWLDNGMQWRHPLSLALTTPPTQTPPSPPVTQINTNSSIPFRELLLQQQQLQLHQQRQQQQHQPSQQSKVNETKPKLTSTSPTILVSDSDRTALASHFHERDRMILQHQQQQMQLQQQLLQTHQQEQMHQTHQTELQQRQLEQREKCLINNNDRLQDYDVSDREKELAIRLKSPGTFIECKFIQHLKAFTSNSIYRKRKFIPFSQ